MNVKFKIDENLPSEAAELFRSAGHDAVTVSDQELTGAPDDRLAAVCSSEDRVLLSLDVGFGDIRAYPPGSHPGIVVLRLASQEKTHVMQTLRRLLPVIDAEPVRGRLFVVDEERVRIRGEE